MNLLINRFKKMRNRKGFTLIELIVVIVIIGILAAIVIPRLSGFTTTARDRANLATARTVYSAAAISEAANPANDYNVSNLVSNGYLETNPNTSGAATFVVSYTGASSGGIKVTWSGDGSGQYPQ